MISFGLSPNYLQRLPLSGRITRLQIFHATCKAESAAAGRAAVDSETRSRSRSASPAVNRPRALTPQPGAAAPFPNSPLRQAVKAEEDASSSSRATTPGVKRKAEDEGGPEVKRERPPSTSVA